MLKHLQKVFSSIIVYDENQHKNNKLTNNYQWFISDDNEIIGIDKNELTDKDLLLLSAFLSPRNVSLPTLTEKEHRWGKIIAGEKELESDITFRFVYFSIKKNQIDPASFSEAVHELFSKSVPILWISEHVGVIIEEKTPQTEEAISYEQIIDVLMSDLYVKLNFFVGPFLENPVKIKQHYTSLIETAKQAFFYSDKSVVTYVDAIPYILVDQTNTEFRHEISNVILREFVSDDELLYTIKTFLHCNLNISVTAKELYMHRNSLQYRLDKFHEKTGIDVRQFNEAMTVYIALLANMHKDE
ncbi:hypothetical protein CIL05_13050 [Virgibacillus profundi]|uniref:PucR C-terminal helix-turn-helix domain-containing protein n=1 Tax=Virgibacillus profundi TaxID=2024555 RepID=A0A2A2ICG1_9BACI|nr:helix-turn-helix domain-containing protein [Virgibacillus profundi]PAV29317.1 hypothetical protein CIL05_13050 [Virgibacillus profundi]PXY53486.1 hypothetical protein CIT14_13175 [Virgibacillus profundi]